MRSSRSGPDPLDPGPTGFAHRGLHGPGVPENSLAAFRAALQIGAGIECDVRLTADNQALIFHDDALSRMCGTAGSVETMKAEVAAGRRLNGTDQHVPWLGELLDLIAGRVPLLIELKACGGNAVPLAAAVAAELADYAGPVGVMSFDAKVSWWFAREMPYLRRGLIVSDKVGALQRWIDVGYGRPHFIAAKRTLLGTRWAAKIRRTKPLYAWTVRTEAERRQAGVQADALIWEGDGRPRT